MVNPHLFCGALLKAMDDGIRNKIDPGKPESRNVTEVWMAGEEEVHLIPLNLRDALDALAKDDVVRSAMPGKLYSLYNEYKQDEWTRFLREVTRAVRAQVGSDYPVFIKYGMLDGVENGLTAEMGTAVVAEMATMGLDGIEISAGIGGEKVQAAKKGIRRPSEEAYFLPLVEEARKITDLPIAVVGGLRSRGVMEDVLASGKADFISLCRPLISEPDLPNLLRTGAKDVSQCISSNNCWAEESGVGIACKCPIDKIAA